MSQLSLFGDGPEPAKSKPQIVIDPARSKALVGAMLAALKRTVKPLRSTMFSVKWVNRDTPAGRKVISLRAASRRTVVDSTGFVLSHWEKTPNASDGEGGVMEIRPGTTGHYKLRDYAHLAAWATPTTQPGGSANESLDDWQARHDKAVADGKGGIPVSLAVQAQMAGWPTTQGRDGEHGGSEDRTTGERRNLDDFAQLAGWPTTRAGDTVNTNETPEEWAARELEAKDKNPNLNGLHKPLGIVVKLAAWPTTNKGDGDGGRVSADPTQTVRPSGHKVQVTLGDATRMAGDDSDKAGTLNPSFSRWLMGLPAEWDQYAPAETAAQIRRRQAAAETDQADDDDGPAE